MPKSYPVATRELSQEKLTVYYCIEENWMHYIHFSADTDTAQPSIPGISQVMPYSELQMRYLRTRAEKDPNIYIFQAKRDKP